MGLHNYGKNAQLNAFFGATAPPGTLYIALILSQPQASDTGSTIDEVSGGSYARVAVTNDVTNWPAASSGAKSNGQTITFPTPTADWGLVQYFAICTALTAGDVIGSGRLYSSKNVISGVAPYFPAGTLTVKAA